MKIIRKKILIIFEAKKKNALEKLSKAKKEELVDVAIIPILSIINQSSNYYTTSSCAGRVSIISKTDARSKHSVIFLLKTHELPTLDQIQKVLTSKQSFQGQIWFNLEPPVFHIGSRTFTDAKNIHRIALEAGMGLTMIKSISRSIIVEARGTGRIEMPIGFDGIIMIDEHHLEKIVSLSRLILKEEQDKLVIWEHSLVKIFSEQ